MSAERFVAQNFDDWEKTAKKNGKSYYKEIDRREFAKEIAVGCFHSEEDIFEALSWYAITESY